MKKKLSCGLLALTMAFSSSPALLNGTVSSVGAVVVSADGDNIVTLVDQKEDYTAKCTIGNGFDLSVYEAPSGVVADSLKWNLTALPSNYAEDVAGSLETTTDGIGSFSPDKAGDYELTATWSVSGVDPDPSTGTSKLTITVSEAELTSLTLEASSKSIKPNTAVTLTVGGVDQCGFEIDTDNYEYVITPTGSTDTTGLIDGDTFTPTAEDTYTIYAQDKTTNTIKSSEVEIVVEDAQTTGVTSITGVPTTGTVDETLDLTTNVVIAQDGTSFEKSAIEWSTETTGASITSGVLTATTTGDVVVKATITDGNGSGIDYTQEFTIAISQATVSAGVTGITGLPTTGTVNEALDLSTTVVIAQDGTSFTASDIEWSTETAGASVTSGSLTATSGGNVVVKASITNGNGSGNDYVKEFTIYMNSVTVATPTVTVDSSTTGLSSTATPTIDNIADVVSATTELQAVDSVNLVIKTPTDVTTLETTADNYSSSSVSSVESTVAVFDISLETTTGGAKNTYSGTFNTAIKVRVTLNTTPTAPTSTQKYVVAHFNSDGSVKGIYDAYVSGTDLTFSTNSFSDFALWIVEIDQTVASVSGALSAEKAGRSDDFKTSFASYLSENDVTLNFYTSGNYNNPVVANVYVDTDDSIKYSTVELDVDEKYSYYMNTTISSDGNRYSLTSGEKTFDTAGDNTFDIASMVYNVFFSDTVLSVDGDNGGASYEYQAFINAVSSDDIKVKAVPQSNPSAYTRGSIYSKDGGKTVGVALGLEENETYTFSLINTDDYGVASSSSSITIAENGNAPTTIAIESLAKTDITFTFDSAKSSTRYTLEIYDANGNEVHTNSATSTSTDDYSVTFPQITNKLTVGRSYSLVVSATNTKDSSKADIWYVGSYTPTTTETEKTLSLSTNVIEGEIVKLDDGDLVIEIDSSTINSDKTVKSVDMNLTSGLVLKGTSAKITGLSEIETSKPSYSGYDVGTFLGGIDVTGYEILADGKVEVTIQVSDPYTGKVVIKHVGDTTITFLASMVNGEVTFETSSFSTFEIFKASSSSISTPSTSGGSTGSSTYSYATYYDSGSVRVNGTIITELQNVLVGELVNLDLITKVNGREVLGWYYDSALTNQITNTSQFVITSDIIANGLYVKLAVASDTLVDGSTNAGAGTTPDTYVPSTVPSTIVKLLGKLF